MCREAVLILERFAAVPVLQLEWSLPLVVVRAQGDLFGFESLSCKIISQLFRAVSRGASRKPGRFRFRMCERVLASKLPMNRIASSEDALNVSKDYLDGRCGGFDLLRGLHLRFEDRCGALRICLVFEIKVRAWRMIRLQTVCRGARDQGLLRGRRLSQHRANIYMPQREARFPRRPPNLARCYFVEHAASCFAKTS